MKTPDDRIYKMFHEKRPDIRDYGYCPAMGRNGLPIWETIEVHDIHGKRYHVTYDPSVDDVYVSEVRPDKQEGRGNGGWNKSTLANEPEAKDKNA